MGANAGLRAALVHRRALRIVPAIPLAILASLAVRLPVSSETPGTISRASVATGDPGAEGNGDSGGAPVRDDGVLERQTALSSDGRYVAFTSLASNLTRDPDRPSPGLGLGEGPVLPAARSSADRDVFVRDRFTHVTDRVSLDSAGHELDGESRSPSISADGRFVAFVTRASFDPEHDGNDFDDVYVRDRVRGLTALISAGVNRNCDASPSGVCATASDGNSFAPSISADGRYVTFASDAKNLDGAEHPAREIYRRDRDPDGNGVFDEQPADPAGLQTAPREFECPGRRPCLTRDAFDGPAMSSDGKHVAFQTLGAGSQVLVWDIGRPVLGFVSWGSGCQRRAPCPDGAVRVPGNGASGEPAISADGRWVAFSSTATNLIDEDRDGVPEDGNGTVRDVFLRDRGGGQEAYDGPLARTLLVSRASKDAQRPNEAANLPSGEPSVSADGRYVAFASQANNLLAPGEGPDTNGRCVPSPPVLIGTIGLARLAAPAPCPPDTSENQSPNSNDVFIRDVVAELTTRVSVTETGGEAVSAQRDQRGADSRRPALSATGRFVAFDSDAVNLDPAQQDHNASRDVFLRDRTPMLSISPLEIDFGEHQVGTVAPEVRVRVTNSGWGPVRFAGAWFGDEHPSDFDLGVTNSCFTLFLVNPRDRDKGKAILSTTLHRGDSCEIGLSFFPAGMGRRTASFLLVYDTESPEPKTLTVKVTGTGLQAVLRLTASIHDFGQQVVGLVSPSATFGLANTGNATADVGRVELGGRHPGDFAITRDECGGKPLPPGGQCSVDAEFRPTARGDRSGVLTVPTSASRDPYAVRLTGRGLVPELIVEPPLSAPGRVVTIRGQDFPAGLPLTLTWNPGSGSVEVVTDDDGDFVQEMLVYRHEEVGSRLIEARPPDAAFVASGPSPEPFLVVAGTVQPSADFLTRR